MQSLRLLFVLVILVCMATSAMSQKTEIELRGGLIISPGYKNRLNEAFPGYQISGGYGWLNVGAGVRIPAAESFSVVPGADLLVNFASVPGEDAVNTIILPMVNASYHFSPDHTGFFIQGGLNLGIVNMGLSRFKQIESDGIGFQILLGYQIMSSAYFEGGYLYIPITYKPLHIWESVLNDNFGGLAVRTSMRF